MQIINFRQNGNNRWERKEKKNTERSEGVVQATVKVWELNGFAECLS